MTKATSDLGIRLAMPSDYPATRMMELSTRIENSDDFHDYVDLTESVLGETVPQGSLFAYLFRRFGYPNRPSDPYKELATYILTTTKPDMLLGITPYAGGNTSISFRFLVTHEVHFQCSRWISRARNARGQAFLDWIESEGRVPDWAEEASEAMANNGWPLADNATGWRRMMPGLAIIAYGGIKDDTPADKAAAITWFNTVTADYEAICPTPPIQWRQPDIGAWEDDDPMKPYAKAIIATLKDLLRPVWIRDCAIDMNGEVDEDNEDELESAEYSKTAGYNAGALGNIDPEGFAKLHHAILALDQDPAAAISKATELLTQTATPDAA